MRRGVHAGRSPGASQKGAARRHRGGPALGRFHRAGHLLLLKKKLLRTWDRFLLPLPFGRGLFLYGEPIRVSREAGAGEQEETRLRLEEALNRLTDEADARMASAGRLR